MQFIKKYFGGTSFIFPFICLLLVIYFNNETLANNLCTFVQQPCVYVVILVLLFYTLNIFRFKYNLSSQISILYLVIFSLSILMNGLMDTIVLSNGYILTIMNISVAFILSKMIRFKDFSKWYVDIIVFFAVCSLLITYIFAPIIRSLPLPHIVNSADVPFINAYLCYLVDYDFYIRNTGVFREAGVWGCFLIFALILTIENQKLSTIRGFLFRVIALVSTIISTFSTACLLSTIIVFIIMLLKRRGKSNNRVSKLWVITCVVLMVSATLYVEIGADALAESVGKLSGESSMNYRTEVIKNSIPFIFDNPLGCGIVRGTNMLAAANTLDAYHNTSTLVAGALYFGWIYILLYMAGLFLFCKRRLASLLYFIPVLILINSEQYIFNPIIYLFIFYGLQRIKC